MSRAHLKDGTTLDTPDQLTPRALADLQFDHRRWSKGGGYDEDQVDDALDLVEARIVDLIRERDAAHEESARARRELRDVQQATADLRPVLPLLADRDALAGVLAAGLHEANQVANTRVVAAGKLPGLAVHLAGFLLGHLEDARHAPGPAEAPTGPGLTPAEHSVVDLLGRAWTTLVEQVIEPGSQQGEDLRELVAPIHAVQNAVLAQAAARFHPDRYRPLGLSHAEWTEARA